MPTKSPPNFALRLEHDTRLVEVSFQKRGDRYAHSVDAFCQIGQQRRRVPLLQSLEGVPADHWPASPPLQACQTLDGEGILATGMAGSSHWSLALTREPNALVWDAACRFKHEPHQLGSAYHILAPIRQAQSGELLLSVEGAGPTFLLALQSSLSGDSACNLLRDHDRLVAQPAVASLAPATARWQYRLDFVQPSSSLLPPSR